MPLQSLAGEVKTPVCLQLVKGVESWSLKSDVPAEPFQDPQIYEVVRPLGAYLVNI